MIPDIKQTSKQVSYDIVTGDVPAVTIHLFEIAISDILTMTELFYEDPWK